MGPGKHALHPLSGHRGIMWARKEGWREEEMIPLPPVGTPGPAQHLHPPNPDTTASHTHTRTHLTWAHLLRPSATGEGERGYP